MSSLPNKKPPKSACEQQGSFYIHWKTQGGMEWQKYLLPKKLQQLPGVPSSLLKDGDALSTSLCSWAGGWLCTCSAFLPSGEKLVTLLWSPWRMANSVLGSATLGIQREERK